MIDKSTAKIGIDLVIPDSGPLISLGHAQRLDLIELFDRPVAVLDVVKLECLRKPSSPDHQALLDWFLQADAGNRIKIIESPLGDAYRKALDLERTGVDRKATRGLGDAALAWSMQNLDRFAGKDAVPLVLVEDRTLSATLSAQNLAHVLSTRAWLAGLENAGLIKSAREIIDDIASNGRNVSELAADKPIKDGGRATDWIAAAMAAQGRGI